MLIRIYSDTQLIDPVPFHNGLNIILGKYSDDKDATGINGIGKSSLVRLIDFMLLSGKAEKRFEKKKYDFLRTEEHTLTLEFKVENTTYFIRRSFAKPKEIELGKSPGKLEEYTKAEMPKILESIFFPTENNQVFFEGKRFGTLMEFFVKDDLQNQRRIDPLNFVSYTANARDKALYNFFLLNLPTKNLINYNEVAKDYEEKGQTITGLTNKIKADTGKDVNEFRTEKLKIEKQITLIESSLKDYNFLENHLDIEKQLTEVIGHINEKSILYHTTNQKLERLKSSYSDITNIDLEKVQKLYNETLSTFGNFVKKSLEEVLEFKKQLLANRNKYLLVEEKKLSSIITTVLAELKELENNRSNLFSILKEKGALDRIESTYGKLIEEKTLLEKNTAIIGQIDEIEGIMADTDIVIAQLKRDIGKDLTKVDNYLNELRLLFQDILEKAIYLDDEFENSYFDIAYNTASRKNQLPFNINIQIPKADALGQERLKIVAYDLMVYLKGRIDQRNTPDFLVHDGVFHAIAKKTIFNVLNYVYHRANALQNFQYIVTFNEDEISVGEDTSRYGGLDFELTDVVVAEFSDTESETLFKRLF